MGGHGSSGQERSHRRLASSSGVFLFLFLLLRQTCGAYAAMQATVTCFGSCSCSESSGTSSGMISDGPRDYGNNESCYWVVAAARVDARVRLSFSHFNTDENSDTVTIRDCSSSTSATACSSPNVIETLSGNLVNSSAVYTSSTPFMQVEFNSGPTGTRSGFVGDWNVVCRAGTFSAASAASLLTCEACGTGTYKTTEMASCVSCSAGTFTTSEGSTACIDCPAGHWCSSASSIPQPCPQNTYREAGGGAGSQSDCNSCPQGTFSPPGAPSQSFCNLTVTLSKTQTIWSTSPRDQTATAGPVASTTPPPALPLHMPQMRLQAQAQIDGVAGQTLFVTCCEQNFISVIADMLNLNVSKIYIYELCDSAIGCRSSKRALLQAATPESVLVKFEMLTSNSMEVENLIKTPGFSFIFSSRLARETSNPKILVTVQLVTETSTVVDAPSPPPAPPRQVPQNSRSNNSSTLVSISAIATAAVVFVSCNLFWFRRTIRKKCLASCLGPANQQTMSQSEANDPAQSNQHAVETDGLGGVTRSVHVVSTIQAYLVSFCTKCVGLRGDDGTFDDRQGSQITPRSDPVSPRSVPGVGDSADGTETGSDERSEPERVERELAKREPPEHIPLSLVIQPPPSLIESCASLTNVCDQKHSSLLETLECQSRNCHQREAQECEETFADGTRVQLVDLPQIKHKDASSDERAETETPLQLLLPACDSLLRDMAARKPADVSMDDSGLFELKVSDTPKDIQQSALEIDDLAPLFELVADTSGKIDSMALHELLQSLGFSEDGSMVCAIFGAVGVALDGRLSLPQLQQAWNHLRKKDSKTHDMAPEGSVASVRVPSAMCSSAHVRVREAATISSEVVGVKEEMNSEHVTDSPQKDHRVSDVSTNSWDSSE